MPDVAYIQPGIDITHVEKNLLFEEGSRRTGLALDGHSPYYLVQTSREEALAFFAPYVGMSFLMATNNTQPITGYWGTWVYDHSHFLAALAGAVNYSGSTYPIIVSNSIRINPLPISYWQQQGRTKLIDRSLLHRSLEAHKRTHAGADYWIEETYSFPPSGDTAGAAAVPLKLQRIRSYEQAELLFEYDGPLTFDFQGRWNAFNFFRAHKIGSGALTLRFRKTDGSIAHTLIVPAYGCKCVRRDPVPNTAEPAATSSVNGIYTEGFAYFQKFIAGDPRTDQHPGANNVYNPSILIPFINHVLAGQQFFNAFDGNNPGNRRFAAPTAMLDPHLRAPLPANYTSGSTALYGNPANDATPLGDCLHHFGDLLDARTDPANSNVVTTTKRRFSGYASLLGGLSGLSVLQQGDDLKIRSSESGVVHDFISLGTNLICTGEGNHIQFPVKDATAFITLDRHNPPRNISPVDRVETTQSVSYNAISGAVVSVPITRRFLQLRADGGEGGGSPSAGGCVPHRDTLADVKTLGKLCHRDYPNPNNAYSTFSASVELTAGGFVVKSTQTIPLSAPFSNPNQINLISDLYNEANLAHFLSQLVIPVLGVNTRHHMELLGNSIVIKRATVFTGYGFPDTDNWTYTGFLTPAYTRIYSDRKTSTNPTLALGHQDFREGVLNLDGHEIVYLQDTAAFLQTEIAIASPWNAPNVQLGLGATGSGPNQVIGTLSNNDVLYGVTKNITTPGYWHGATGAGAPLETNRKRAHANLIFFNVPQDGSDFSRFPGNPTAGTMYRFERMEIAAAHYNNLAAKVNSIVRVRPLNALDHGVIQNGNDQTVRYRLTPNRFGLWDALQSTAYWLALSQTDKNDTSLRFHQRPALRPARQFAAFGTGNSVVAGYAGIPLRSIADLPDAFLAKKGTTDRRTNIQQLPFTVTHIEEPRVVRPELNAITVYNWLHLDDVKNYWEARGYKFIFAEIGVGLNLGVFEASGFQLIDLMDNQPTTNGIPSRQVEFVPADGDGTWIAGDGIRPIQKQPMLWAERAMFKIIRGNVGTPNKAIVGVDYPEPFRRVNFHLPERARNLPSFQHICSARNPGGKFFGEVPYTGDVVCRAPMVVKVLSGGIADNSAVLELPLQQHVSFTPNFLDSGLAARQAHTDTQDGRVFPFTAQAGASHLVLWSDFTLPVLP